jgi:hypothetical protein
MSELSEKEQMIMQAEAVVSSAREFLSVLRQVNIYDKTQEEISDLRGEIALAKIRLDTAKNNLELAKIILQPVRPK